VGLGIDLADDGVTPNDAGDADPGPNDLQNFPELTYAGSGSGRTRIEGTLAGQPSSQYLIEFFSDTSCDPSGFGEGRTFLGSTSVTTSGPGAAATFSARLDTAVGVGEVVTATATQGDVISEFIPLSGTSEFSRCETVVAAPPTPPNDDFANATPLSGSTASRNGDTNVNATRETGEPLIAGDPGGHSVWYAWTAPTTGPFTLDTAGSNFNTLLGVYTGPTVSGLTPVAQDDDSGPGTTSQVTFAAQSGVTYGIVVDGFGGAVGSVNLHLTPTPSGCTITGTAGADTLIGTSGNDVICGLGDDDVLRGLGGNDTLLGGDGNDTLQPGVGNDPSVDGGPGNDTVSFTDLSAAVTVNLSTLKTGAGAGTDTLVSIENAAGSGLNDTLTGNAADNVLSGRAGNDSLLGANGNDTLNPGAGNDPSVNGGSGADTVSYSDLTTAVSVNLATLTTGGAAGTDTLVSIENATGTNAADTLAGSIGANTLTGRAGDDALTGDAGNDTLLPGAGNDPVVDGGAGVDAVSYADLTTGVTVDLTLATTGGAAGTDPLTTIENAIGTNAADTLTGSAGANVLYGRGGADTIKGEAGTDTLYPGTGTDPLVDGGIGTDTVNYSDLTTGAVTVNLVTNRSGGAAGIDVLAGIERATGTGFNDTLTGNTGNNLLSGLAGDDLLRGDAGTDTLDGGANTVVGDTCIDPQNATFVSCEITGTV
jgi:Ca2+-binding RTX toxin-like protein